VPIDEVLVLFQGASCRFWNGDRPVDGRVRILLLAVLALIGALLPAHSAFAEGYSVDFGADTDLGRDAGTIECQFDDSCVGKLESLGLTIRLQLRGGRFGFADVALEAGNLGCCYFANTTRSIGIDPRGPLSRLPLFKGRGPRGGLFIQNEPTGTCI
jgi:hypothetical protein